MTPKAKYLEASKELTDNYTPPLDACNTYKVTFALLKEFED
jgi:regulator of cell morphogenesis and NO signaling